MKKPTPIESLAHAARALKPSSTDDVRCGLMDLSDIVGRFQFHSERGLAPGYCRPEVVEALRLAKLHLDEAIRHLTGEPKS